MDIHTTPYLNVHKFLLSCVGAWPYQSKLRKRLTFIFFGISLSSSMLSMGMGLIQEMSMDIVIYFETLVGVATIFGSIEQCIVLYVRENQLIQLYKKIDANWRSITDVKELEILNTFSVRGRTLTLIFSGITISSYVLFLSLTYIPIVLHYGIAAKDYLKIFPYYSKQWVIDDSMKHLQAFVHGALGVFCGGVPYITVIAVYICSVEHVCGMYAIVGLKKLISSNEKIPNELKGNKNILTDMYGIIQLHEEALKGAQWISAIFTRLFFAIELFLLICLAFIIFAIQFSIHNIELMFRVFLISVILIAHVFYMNYGGEQIIEFSSEIHTATYYMEWYLMSIKARKTLLMIVRRSYKPESLTAGIMKLSMENFALIIKTAWSAATVLMSVNKEVQ